MSFTSLLFWYDERPAWLKRTVAAAAGAAIYGAGYLLIVSPALEARQEARADVEDVERRIRSEQERLAAFTPPDPELEERVARTADSLAPPDSLRRIGLESGLLTALSRLAEDAGVTAPIFNPAGAPAGDGRGPSLPLVSVQGRFSANLRAVSRFLIGLEDLPVAVFLDSLAVTRDETGDRVTVALRAVRARPGEEEGGAGRVR